MENYLSNLSTKHKIIIGVMALIIIVLLFIFTYRYFYTEENEDKIIANEAGNLNEIEDDEQAFGLSSKKSKVVVHVIGEVNNPGVVTLDEGARIIDAITAAGNITEEADLSKINLAYIIEDGTQIYIPRVGEIREEYITESAGEGVVVDSATLDQSEIKEIKVNINTATLDKLQTLPGVGNSTAQKIIDYRTENGKFKTEEDLKNVPGIGESKYNNLKDKITVK